MDFTPTDERRQLADSLRRYLAQNCGAEHRRRMAYEAPFHDPALWTGLADLGAIGALIPESAGGYGGAGYDVAVVFEELGAALCPEPMLAALMAGRVMAAAGADCSALVDGRERIALAFGEPGEAAGRGEPPQTRAERHGGAWRLTGRKSVVYGGHSADRLIVTAMHERGQGLFVINAADAQVQALGLIDGGGAAEITLDACPADCLLEQGEAALEEALDFATLALCAEAVGATGWMAKALADYLGTRKQFGRPIGSFQALRHRYVDLNIEAEQARSITLLAASRMDSALRARTLSMAKALGGRTARLWAEESIQMHGGIAMTWEATVSHYAKRLVMIDHQLGDELWHLERVAAGYAEAG
jgi:alkylation response protein AidB-like acyl-CoA dehydrogenase